MNRPILTLVLAAALLAGAPSTPARAAADGAFATVSVYQEQFTDVRATDWYYENVKALYELGLTNGQGDGRLFAPEADMTLAETLTMAARLRSLYEYGDGEAGPSAWDGGGVWYRPYVTYLQSVGIIGDEFEGSYLQKATRAQMAHVLANTLPESLFPSINGEIVAVGYSNRTYIRDINEDTPYCREILTLYEWGILSGMDRTGSFHPDETIPRCQVAAMVTRLVYSDLRIQLPWDYTTAYSREGTTMADLVYSDGTFYKSPEVGNLEEVDADVRYMLSRGERLLSLSYEPGTLTTQSANDLMQAFLDTARYYVEQTYNEIQCSYSTRTGTMELAFSSSFYEDSLIDSYRESTMAYAIQVHDEMWANKTITPSMSEYDKARIYFTWICEHCRYDFGASSGSMSHSGYQAFASGLAVCDGYTAAYNLLLKLEGISCTTYSTADHIWTIAELDGTSYHIDTTWGDHHSGTIAYRYFAMTEADALARF